jgi:hypothetical protein
MISSDEPISSHFRLNASSCFKEYLDGSVRLADLGAVAPRASNALTARAQSPLVSPRKRFTCKRGPR